MRITLMVAAQPGVTATYTNRHGVALTDPVLVWALCENEHGRQQIVGMVPGETRALAVPGPNFVGYGEPPPVKAITNGAVRHGSS